MHFQIVEIQPVNTPYECVDALLLVANVSSYEEALVKISALERENIHFSVYGILATPIKFPIRQQA